MCAAASRGKGGVVLGAKGRYNRCMNKPSNHARSIKVTRIGNSAGIILPKELLARLRVDIGDDVYVSEAADGLRVTASDPDFEMLMDMAEGIMRKDRDILKVLAK
ncbi:AbrB/MazE/SpoVT family DNA-binding domain-containing protein [Erythrobacter sp. WG]|nr:AbrB/MazE/SpoVT family DNA-binding domain-containing protein [Erythrobacter sp. WG]